jgi:hypothetical protein
MNVQLFDQHGQPCFRMYTSEHVWKRFWTHVGTMIAPARDAPSVQDFELAAPLVPDILKMLEADLVSAKQEVQASSASGPLSHVEILGDVLALNLRVEAHAQLHRLMLLHRALSRVVANGVSLQVVFAPALESSHYYLAAVLKHETESVNREQARTALVREYDRLIALDDATDEQRARWRRARSVVEDDNVMDALIDDLARLGLVRRSQDGTQIAATPKLLMITL